MYKVHSTPSSVWWLSAALVLCLMSPATGLLCHCTDRIHCPALVCTAESVCIYIGKSYERLLCDKTEGFHRADRQMWNYSAPATPDTPPEKAMECFNSTWLTGLQYCVCNHGNFCATQLHSESTTIASDTATQPGERMPKVPHVAASDRMMRDYPAQPHSGSAIYATNCALLAIFAATLCLHWLEGLL